MIRLMPVPQGWEALERHLLEWHDIPLPVVEVLNHDDAKKVHADLHRPNTHLNYGGRPKRHEHT